MAIVKVLSMLLYLLGLTIPLITLILNTIKHLFEKDKYQITSSIELNEKLTEKTLTLMETIKSNSRNKHIEIQLLANEIEYLLLIIYKNKKLDKKYSKLSYKDYLSFLSLNKKELYRLYANHSYFYHLTGSRIEFDKLLFSIMLIINTISQYTLIEITSYLIDNLFMFPVLSDTELLFLFSIPVIAPIIIHSLVLIFNGISAILNLKMLNRKLQTK